MVCRVGKMKKAGASDPDAGFLKEDARGWVPQHLRPLNPPSSKERHLKPPVIMIANGDLRLVANRQGWPAQAQAEQAVRGAIERFGYQVRRGHEYDPVKQHGFIDGQKRGIEVFRAIPKNAPLVVVEAVWQYSQQLLPGLLSHTGPILTIANWSGQFPGLVGLLNLNGSLRKAGVAFDSLWSADFADDFFLNGVKTWLNGERIRHDLSHVRPLRDLVLPEAAAALGAEAGREIRENRAILGVFDEGCMGMYNAIIPDEMLHGAGVFKERLSQSALYAEMLRTSDQEAAAVHEWLLNRGMRFATGPNPETDLTEAHILEQCRMYIAAVRIADEFGCDAIGIQYQLGLKDLTPASDLAEGLMNDSDRPPVRDRSGRVLYEHQPLPHFNEADECAGLDALVTNRVWRRLGFPPETTLHDVRYGETARTGRGERFVWTFEISGAVPPAHLAGGYAGAVSERQPYMYFQKGGGGIKGVSKPGDVVWSRIFVEPDGLKADIGRADAVELPAEETERRWRMTTPQWPMMHAVLHGVSRDQLMARHASNHIQVAYAPGADSADRALIAKAAAFRELGIEVSICGTARALEETPAVQPVFQE